MDPLSELPKSFAAGETVEYIRTVSDYPAPDWTLKAILQGESKLVKAATVSGTDHKVTLDATETAALVSGLYQYVEKVQHSDGRKFYLADPVTITVLPDFEAVAAGALKSPEEKELALVEARIADLLSDGIKTASISGGGAIRTVDLISLETLTKRRRELKAIIKAKQNPGTFATPIRTRYLGGVRA